MDGLESIAVEEREEKVVLLWVGFFFLNDGTMGSVLCSTDAVGRPKKSDKKQKRHTHLVKQSIETCVDGRGLRERREEI